MPRGGARPGAGRKPNIKNGVKLTRLGFSDPNDVMPATVMIENMRLHYAIAQDERKKGSKADINIIAAEMNRAHQAASDVAPYYHPKLAALQSNVNFTGRLTLEALVLNSLEKSAVAANDDTVAEMLDITPRETVEEK